MKLYEINKRKIEILDKITEIHNTHPENNTGCRKVNCEICHELRALGAEYERLTIVRRESNERVEEKVQRILAKGQDATKSEIKYLLEKGKMSRREVSGAIKIGSNTFAEICRSWGFERVSTRRKTG